MIKKLILKNFRNYNEKEFFFKENINLIIGENGLGKTNILEAISILANNPIQEINFESLVKIGEKNMFISGDFENILAISFLKEEKKKKYIVNQKFTTKKNFSLYGDKTVNFSPFSLNLFYLSPSYRRKFLDEILKNSFLKYSKALKNFENILKQRNNFLKAVKNEKEKIENIDFWNSQYIEKSIEIYRYRKNLINFLQKNINSLEKYFLGKNIKLSFKYISKINLDEKILNNNNFFKILEKNFLDYFEKNLEKEIILARTTIGPHLDDFDIFINNSYKIIDFASRGEIKSVILGLKFLEIQYLEKNLEKKPIILIDDFLSEIDDKHKNLLLANLKDYQTIITSIKELGNDVFKNANKIFVK